MSAPDSREDQLDLPGPVLTGEAWSAACRLATDLRSSPGHPYPWDGLEDELERNGNPLRLVAYGSLMNTASAAGTLQATRQAGEPVLALGVRRVFNYIMPESSLGRFGPRPDPDGRAALNVYLTPNLADVVNGLCLEVETGDLTALRNREKGYSLLPVVCLCWHQPTAPPYVAHILGVPDNLEGKQFTDDTLRPHREYYFLCRAGAAAVSRAFLDCFLDTTFLADRRTPVRCWEQENEV
jgi:hypothetical protein